MSSDTPAPLFTDLGLPQPLLQALAAVGYESPSPIQAATIPPLLAGRDVLGQAQTGTGKTAAFALPAMARLDPAARKPQVLVLAPTRELAIQVAEAFQKYAAFLPGFQVLPIYGGQGYGPQLQALRRGVQVVVGTPGRVIDHIEKGSLDLSELRMLVLDEADEMLRMGFIDDVEAVLARTPESRQVALFSATMPPPIRRIAQTYLRDPVEVAIKSATSTARNIRQRYWMVSGTNKLDAITRILEAEPFDGMIVFTRTKQATEELAEKLQARGFAAAAINGDIAQPQRERTIAQLKDGKIDILVATDVAARGLDVDRISHVLNYDVPYDTESYVHRIGRTGRAGRSGEAILFIAPRERNLLRAIERATRQPIEQMDLPTVENVNDARIGKFKQSITDTLATGELALFQSLVEDYEREFNVPAVEIAAALAKMARGDVPLLMEAPKREPRPARGFDGEDRGGRERPGRHERDDRPAFPKKERVPRPPQQGMQTFRVEVGYDHGVKPGNIVGAIANEANIESKHIGRIEIFEDHSLIDLPEGMPPQTMAHLKGVWCAGQQLRITLDGEPPDTAGKSPGRKPFVKKPFGKKPFPPRKPHRKGPRPG
ncbi:DEAD/DEAH box helicase [Luteimonas arsenica]|uniref:DEAD/DEAH box helicase n=1 Tax=Luteimonas arsenica TaxID=1586242 RepID=UPI001055F7C4|nr:DEAD/DEAH box helicase [Luteimonas arsenica]